MIRSWSFKKSFIYLAQFPTSKEIPGLTNAKSLKDVLRNNVDNINFGSHDQLIYHSLKHAADVNTAERDGLHELRNYTEKIDRYRHYVESIISNSSSKFEESFEQVGCDKTCSFTMTIGGNLLKHSAIILVKQNGMAILKTCYIIRKRNSHGKSAKCARRG